MSDDEGRILLESGISLQGAIDDMKRLRQTLLDAANKTQKDMGDAAAKGAQLMSKAQLQAALSTKSHADQVKLLDEQIKLATVNTTKYYNLQTQRAKAQAAADRDEAAATKRQIADAAKFTNEKLKQEQAERRLALASTNRAGQIKILETALEKQTKGSIEYLKIQEKIARLESGGGGNGAPPRTFAGFAGNGALQLAGALGLVTSLTQGLQQLNEQANKGVEINASIDGNRRALGSFLQDVERGNNVFQRASQYGREYGFTQEQIAEATRGASSIIKNSAADVEKILEVQSRLQSVSPEQSLSEASLAIKELSGGDIQSIVRRFEIARSTANEWKQEIADGADVIDVLDRGLADLGVTQNVIEQRTQGLIGAQNRYNQSIEDWERALGNLKQSSGYQAITTDVINVATRAIGGEIPNTENDEIIRSSGNYQTYRELLQARIQSYVLMGETSKARELEISLLTKEQFATRQLTLAQQAAIEARQELTKQGPSNVPGVYDATPLEVMGRASQVLETDIASLNIEIAKQQLQIKQATAALAPYEQAVTDAAAANEAAKEGLKNAEADFEMWKGARIEGERELNEQIYQLSKERAQADYDLNAFKNGGGLDAVLDPYLDDIAESEQATLRLNDAFDAQQTVVDDAERAVKDETKALEKYDEAVKVANKALDDNKERRERVTQAIKDQDDALNRHASTLLVGDREDRDRLQAQDRAIDRLRLERVKRERAGADDDDLEGLDKQIEALRLAREQAQLEIELSRGVQHEELQDAATSRDPVETYGDALEGIESALNETERLNGLLPGIDQDIANSQQALQDATAAQEAQNQKITDAKQYLDDQKIALDLANDALKTQKERTQDLQSAMETAEKAALKPFEDRINTISLAAQKAELTKFLGFDDLHHQMEIAADDAKEFPYQTIIDGIQKSHEQVGFWRDKVAETTTNLDLAKAALERQKEPIEAQQGRLDELNLRLDATKIDLQEINKAQDEYVEDAPTVNKEIDEKTRLYGLWGQAMKDLSDNFGSAYSNAQKLQGLGPIYSPGPRAGTDPYGSPFGGPKVNPAYAQGSGYDINAVNQILEGTGLEGYGATLAALARDQKIPLQYALAMLQKESSFLDPRNNISVENNNPGNLKFTNTTESYGAVRGEAAADGGYWAKFADVTQGLEGYFRLLRDAYGDWVDEGPDGFDKIIAKYAPPKSNNTAQYQQQIRAWAADFLEQILATTSTAVQRPDGSLLDQLIAALNPQGSLTQGYHTGPGWGGIDIGAPEGTDIRAVQAGKVIHSAFSEVGGWTVIIEDVVTGLKTYYGHMQEMGVEVGKIVEAGDVIGKVGSTGQATGPHIHFQAWLNNVLQNPLQMLAQLVEAAYGTGAGVDVPWDNAGGDSNKTYTPSADRTTGDPTAPTIADPDEVERTNEKMRTLLMLFAEMQATLDPNDPRSIDMWAKRFEQAILSLIAPTGQLAEELDYVTKPVGDPTPITPGYNSNDPTVPPIIDPGLLDASTDATQRLRDAWERFLALNDFGPDSPFASVVRDLSSMIDLGAEMRTGDPEFPIIGDIATPVEDQAGRIKRATDEGLAALERWKAGERTGGQLGVGDHQTVGDEALFGGGGGAYGYSDPRPDSIIGDTSIGEDLQYGISDPIGESLLTTTNNIDALKDLFTPSNWSQTNEDVRITWELNRDHVIEPWRTAIDYVRSGADLIHRMAAQARLDAETVRNAADGAGGGGGGNGGAPPAAAPTYVTNVYTENPNRLYNAARQRGKV